MRGLRAAGQVRGRSVRVRMDREVKGTHSKVRRTLIEASLSSPVEMGVVVGQSPATDPAEAAPSFGPISVETRTVDDEFWVVGDEALAGEVLTGEVREALKEAGEVSSVYAGDVSNYLKERSPKGATSNRVAEKLASPTTSQQTPGDGTTVIWKRNGAIIDPEKLERSVNVVAAVADAFEAARTGSERTAETEPWE